MNLTRLQVALNHDDPDIVRQGLDLFRETILKQHGALRSFGYHGRSVEDSDSPSLPSSDKSCEKQKLPEITGLLKDYLDSSPMLEEMFVLWSLPGRQDDKALMKSHTHCTASILHCVRVNETISSRLVSRILNDFSDSLISQLDSNSTGILHSTLGLILSVCRTTPQNCCECFRRVVDCAPKISHLLQKGKEVSFELEKGSSISTNSRHLISMIVLTVLYYSNDSIIAEILPASNGRTLLSRVMNGINNDPSWTVLCICRGLFSVLHSPHVATTSRLKVLDSPILQKLLTLYQESSDDSPFDEVVLSLLKTYSNEVGKALRSEYAGLAMSKATLLIRLVHPHLWPPLSCVLKPLLESKPLLLDNCVSSLSSAPEVSWDKLSVCDSHLSAMNRLCELLESTSVDQSTKATVSSIAQGKKSDQEIKSFVNTLIKSMLPSGLTRKEFNKLVFSQTDALLQRMGLLLYRRLLERLSRCISEVASGVKSNEKLLIHLVASIPSHLPDIQQIFLLRNKHLLDLKNLLTEQRNSISEDHMEKQAQSLYLALLSTTVIESSLQHFPGLVSSQSNCHPTKLIDDVCWIMNMLSEGESSNVIDAEEYIRVVEKSLEVLVLATQADQCDWLGTRGDTVKSLVHAMVNSEAPTPRDLEACLGNNKHSPLYRLLILCTCLPYPDWCGEDADQLATKFLSVKRLANDLLGEVLRKSGLFYCVDEVEVEMNVEMKAWCDVVNDIPLLAGFGDSEEYICNQLEAAGGDLSTLHIHQNMDTDAKAESYAKLHRVVSAVDMLLKTSFHWNLQVVLFAQQRKEQYKEWWPLSPLVYTLLALVHLNFDIYKENFPNHVKAHLSREGTDEDSSDFLTNFHDVAAKHLLEVLDRLLLKIVPSSLNAVDYVSFVKSSSDLFAVSSEGVESDQQRKITSLLTLHSELALNYYHLPDKVDKNLFCVNKVLEGSSFAARVVLFVAKHFSVLLPRLDEDETIRDLFSRIWISILSLFPLCLSSLKTSRSKVSLCEDYFNWLKKRLKEYIPRNMRPIKREARLYWLSFSVQFLCSIERVCQHPCMTKLTDSPAGQTAHSIASDLVKLVVDIVNLENLASCCLNVLNTDAIVKRVIENSPVGSRYLQIVCAVSRMMCKGNKKVRNVQSSEGTVHSIWHRVLRVLRGVDVSEYSSDALDNFDVFSAKTNRYCGDSRASNLMELCWNVQSITGDDALRRSFINNIVNRDKGYKLLSLSPSTTKFQPISELHSSILLSSKQEYIRGAILSILQPSGDSIGNEMSLASLRSNILTGITVGTSHSGGNDDVMVSIYIDPISLVLPVDLFPLHGPTSSLPRSFDLVLQCGYLRLSSPGMAGNILLTLPKLKAQKSDIYYVGCLLSLSHLLSLPLLSSRSFDLLESAFSKCWVDISASYDKSIRDLIGLVFNESNLVSSMEALDDCCRILSHLKSILLEMLANDIVFVVNVLSVCLHALSAGHTASSPNLSKFEECIITLIAPVVLHHCVDCSHGDNLGCLWNALLDAELHFLCFITKSLSAASSGGESGSLTSLLNGLMRVWRIPLRKLAECSNDTFLNESTASRVVAYLVDNMETCIDHGLLECPSMLSYAHAVCVEMEEHDSLVSICSSKREMHLTEEIRSRILSHSQFLESLNRLSANKADTFYPFLRLFLYVSGQCRDHAEEDSGSIRSALMRTYKGRMTDTDRVILRLLSVMSSSESMTVTSLHSSFFHSVPQSYCSSMHAPSDLRWLATALTPPVVYATLSQFPAWRSGVPQPFSFESDAQSRVCQDLLHASKKEMAKGKNQFELDKAREEKEREREREKARRSRGRNSNPFSMENIVKKENDLWFAGTSPEDMSSDSSDSEADDEDHTSEEDEDDSSTELSDSRSDAYSSVSCDVFSAQRDEGKDVLDPAYWIPAIYYWLSFDPHLSMRVFANCGALSLLLATLSSECVLLRSFALAALRIVLKQLRQQTPDKDSSFRERPQLLVVVSFVKNAISYDPEGEDSDDLTVIQRPLPFSTAMFLARAALHVLQPHHPLFSAVNKYLLSRPCLDVKDIPLYDLLVVHSTSDGADDERLAALRFLRDSLGSHEDHLNMCRKNAYGRLMVYFSLFSHNANILHAILDLLERALMLPASARYVIERCSFIPWLQQIISPSITSKAGFGTFSGRVLVRCLSLLRLGLASLLQVGKEENAFHIEYLELMSQCIHGLMKDIAGVNVSSLGKTISGELISELVKGMWDLTEAMNNRFIWNFAELCQFSKQCIQLHSQKRLEDNVLSSSMLLLGFSRLCSSEISVPNDDVSDAVSDEDQIASTLLSVSFMQLHSLKLNSPTPREGLTHWTYHQTHSRCLASDSTGEFLLESLPTRRTWRQRHAMASRGSMPLSRDMRKMCALTTNSLLRVLAFRRRALDVDNVFMHVRSALMLKTFLTSTISSEPEACSDASEMVKMTMIELMHVALLGTVPLLRCKDCQGMTQLSDVKQATGSALEAVLSRVLGVGADVSDNKAAQYLLEEYLASGPESFSLKDLSGVQSTLEALLAVLSCLVTLHDRRDEGDSTSMESALLREKIAFVEDCVETLNGTQEATGKRKQSDCKGSRATNSSIRKKSKA